MIAEASGAAAPLSDADRLVRRTVIGAAALAGLAAAADIVFLDHGSGFPVPGLSITVFMALVGAAACLVNADALRPGSLALGLPLLLLTLAPSAENVGFLSWCFAVLGTALFARVVTAQLPSAPVHATLATLWTAVAGPLQGLMDLNRLLPALRSSRVARFRIDQLLVWALPLALGAVFAVLFTAANPVIKGWVEAIDLERLLEHIQIGRVVFWGMIAAGCWSFVFVHRVSVSKNAPKATPAAPPTADSPLEENLFFGRSAVLRSLALFNILFAAQTGMDVAYLWIGAALPDDLTYAEYARHGAYALLAAALLAAGFMLAAIRTGSAVTRAPIIRWLAYLWMAQTILLVGSSMRRLGFYIEAYSLTHMRVAALIWMGLVAVGLVLIVWRIAFQRSAAWLVASNAAVLAATLYVCCFINFASVIASYNLAHSREATGEGPALDTYHLCELGPNAAPVISRFLAEADRATRDRLIGSRAWAESRSCVRQWRTNGAFDAETDWRSWTYRRWRTARAMGDTPWPAP